MRRLTTAAAMLAALALAACGDSHPTAPVRAPAPSFDAVPADSTQTSTASSPVVAPDEVPCPTGQTRVDGECRSGILGGGGG